MKILLLATDGTLVASAVAPGSAAVSGGGGSASESGSRAPVAGAGDGLPWDLLAERVRALLAVPSGEARASSTVRLPMRPTSGGGAGGAAEKGASAKSGSVEIRLTPLCDATGSVRFVLGELPPGGVDAAVAGRTTHDVNNRLAGIKNAGLLLRDVVPPGSEHEEYLQLIDAEIDRISAAMKDFYTLLVG